MTRKLDGVTSSNNKVVTFINCLNFLASCFVINDGSILHDEISSPLHLHALSWTCSQIKLHNITYLIEYLPVLASLGNHLSKTTSPKNNIANQSEALVPVTKSINIFPLSCGTCCDQGLLKQCFGS